MAFTLETWRTQLPERLQNWRRRMVGCGVDSVYAWLGAMTLWPVAQAATSGDVSAWVALGGVLAGVGTNLVANRVQGWKDEADAARDIASELPHTADFRDELTSILRKLDTVALASNALPDETERTWLAETLRQELQRYGADASTITLIGSGVIATDGSTVAQDNSVAVGGDVYGPITTNAAKKSEK